MNQKGQTQKSGKMVHDTCPSYK